MTVCKVVIVCAFASALALAAEPKKDAMRTRTAAESAERSEKKMATQPSPESPEALLNQDYPVAFADAEKAIEKYKVAGGLKLSVFAAEPLLEKLDLFTAGADGYALYRIPGLVVAKKGTVLA